MRITSLMIILSMVIPSAGRSDEPTAPAPAAAPVPAAVAGAADSSAPATTLQPTVEKTPAQLKRDAAEAKIKQYGSNGYKPETTKAGDIVYCKREATIGSRFETKQCRTFEQLRDESLSGKEYLEQLQHVVPPHKG